MQRKPGHWFSYLLLIVFYSCLMLSRLQAAKPLWTFIPQTSTEITITKKDNVQVIYRVLNSSSRAKILIMKPIPGVSQGAPCQLSGHGSCTLTLNVHGSGLQGDIVGGPVLCQLGNNLQCFQPSTTVILRVHLIEPPPIQQFTITPVAGVNGSISPATAQVVNPGSSVTFTAIPQTGFVIDQWLLDGNVVQNGGTTYQLNNIQFYTRGYLWSGNLVSFDTKPGAIDK